ncbi:MAG: YihY/virulence factor BrkB family protein [Methylobacterium mesophilicum]|nr:YihY/virulence factor BrkB family protein [Methylobacterium mesophilicum]
MAGASALGNSNRRGRDADSPAQVPAAGWKDILFRTYQEISDDRVTLIAAAVTYYLLLAIFPALTAFVSLYGLFTDPATVGEHIGALAQVVPEGGMRIINEQLTRLTTSGNTKLGFALIISLCIALWSTSSGVKTLFEAMNIAYGEREKRSFIKLNATALLFTLAGLVGALLMIGATVVVPVALDFIGLGGALDAIVRIGSFVVLALVILTGIALLYRFGPSRQEAKWRWITPGAALALVIIIVISSLFSWYAANFAQFDKTYGSLGGLIGMLFWMWLSVTAVIVGAELNAESEKQTAKDSTKGTDDPMGRRAANAADTLAPGGGAQAPSSERASPFEGRSDEWQAGYQAAIQEIRDRRRPSAGTMALALPLSLAIGAMERRRRR